MKKQLLILMTLCISILGYSQTVGDTFIDNFITYEVTSLVPNEVEAHDYDHNNGSTDVDIPATVSNSGTVFNVTSIGQDAFDNNGPNNLNLTSVIIPNTIITIGDDAFNSQYLTTVTVPNSVISIGASVFVNNDLTTAIIGNNVTSIGLSAFQGNQLTSIIIPNSVSSIGNYAFQSNQLTNATLSNSLTSIGYSAFKQNQLQSVVIPNGITSINDAFSYNQLTSLTLPNGLTNIDISAFRSNNLTHVTIPNTVTNIEYSAFRDNPLATVTSQATTPPTIYVPGINDSFWNRSIIDLTIPSGTLAAYAAGGWTGFQSVTEATTPIVGDVFMVNYIIYEVTSIAPNTVEVINYDSAGSPIVDIPASVTHSVTTYDVTNIAGGAFQSKNITHVTIPNSVTNIEISAFHTNQLTSVIISESVTNIGPIAFLANPLSSVTSLGTTPPTINTSSSSDTFSTNRSNINLILPNGTTDEYVTDNGALWTGFKMVYEDTSTTANTLEVTDYHAANGTTVTIPAAVTAGSVVYDVTEIGDAAFFSKGLTNLTFTLPSNITSIGTSTFNTNNLTSVTIPDSVLTIGSQAFVTNDLANVSIGNNVWSIGLGAFVDNDLTSVTFPNSVTEIGPIAFAANPLTSVTSLATIPPTITTGNNDTFDINGDRSNIHLTIPNGTENAYIAAQWINFASVTLNISDFELANTIKVITTIDEIQVVSTDSVRLEKYTMYSISGAKITTGNSNKIDTTALANGIYILKLDFDQGTVVKKVALN